MLFRSNEVLIQATTWKKIFANEELTKDYLQNMQAAHTAQYQKKNKQPNQKMGRKLK